MLLWRAQLLSMTDICNARQYINMYWRRVIVYIALRCAGPPMFLREKGSRANRAAGQGRTNASATESVEYLLGPYTRKHWVHGACCWITCTVYRGRQWPSSMGRHSSHFIVLSKEYQWRVFTIFFGLQWRRCTRFTIFCGRQYLPIGSIPSLQSRQHSIADY